MGEAPKPGSMLLTVARSLLLTALLGRGLMTADRFILIGQKRGQGHRR